MLNIPYIGITDFRTFEEAERMLAVFKKHVRPWHNRRLHVGVMMSHKTLHNLPTKWANAFPPRETIARIFGHTETMNCLHYADYEGIDTFRSLFEAMGFGGSGMNALQLDMVWPKPDDVDRAIWLAGKQLEVILQVGQNAIDAAHNDPQEVVARLRTYEGIINHVLLDKSMGRGIGMDAVGLIPFAKAIREAFPTLGIGAAGGLGPGSVELIRPLLDEFPTISIDAQSKLRPSGNALDPINWNMAEEYLIEALQVL